MQLVVFILVLAAHQCLASQPNPFYNQNKEYNENYDAQEADESNFWYDNEENLSPQSLPQEEVQKKSYIQPEGRLKRCREFVATEVLGNNYYPTEIKHIQCEALDEGEPVPPNSRVCHQTSCSATHQKFHYVELGKSRLTKHFIFRKSGCMCNGKQYKA